MGAVTSLCPTAIWLEGGQIRKRASSPNIVGEYLASKTIGSEQTVSLANRPRERWLTDDRVRIQSLEWLSDFPLRHGEPAIARIRFRVRAPVSSVSVAIGFSSIEGVRLLSYETDFPSGRRPDLTCPGDYFVDLFIDALPLAPDTYSWEAGCRSGDSHPLDYIAAGSQIDVVVGPSTPGYIARKGAGVRLESTCLWELASAPQLVCE
jgi:hypothetical protein